jgi:UDP-N-acetylmuramyl pentapeptide phosphotransferase/UDP-N-acetylglucosamine-1-phosphate transferase
VIWIVLACGVGLLSWRLTDWLAGRASTFGPIDHPNDRSLHHLPTPRTGGAAIVVSALVGVIAWSLIVRWTSVDSAFALDHLSEMIWILGGSLFLAGISFLDDREGLPVWIRFGCHLIAACGVIFGGKAVIHSLTLPGFGAIELGWAASPLTLAFLLWMTNLYNFMDGMDGFAGGMTVAGFGLMGYFFWIGNQPVVSGIAMFQATAAVGFLLHNFPPARIFMGDAGSISTGFLAGSLAVLGSRERIFDLWVPLLIFSPFILDATVTLLRRSLRREKLWCAHREHYYQRLVLSGWGHRRAVLAEYAVMAACGLLALLYHAAAERQRLIILGVWVVLFLALAGLVKRVQGGTNMRAVR